MHRDDKQGVTHFSAKVCGLRGRASVKLSECAERRRVKEGALTMLLAYLKYDQAKELSFEDGRAHHESHSNLRQMPIELAVEVAGVDGDRDDSLVAVLALELRCNQDVALKEMSVVHFFLGEICGAPACSGSTGSASTCGGGAGRRAGCRSRGGQDGVRQTRW